jgi:hypothetical protein
MRYDLTVRAAETLEELGVVASGAISSPLLF